MPDTVTVWMVQLDVSPEDVEGTLELTAATVRFAPAAGGSPHDIALADVSRVKRIWGSPVLLVHSVEGGQRHATAFYFSKPPPLHPPAPAGDEPPPTLIGPFNRNRPPSKRKQRRTNAGYLANASNAVGDDVRVWAREVRAAVAAARRTRR
jgi:hypothetical protein